MRIQGLYNYLAEFDQYEEPEAYSHEVVELLFEIRDGMYIVSSRDLDAIRILLSSPKFTNEDVALCLLFNGLDIRIKRVIAQCLHNKPKYNTRYRETLSQYL